MSATYAGRVSRTIVRGTARRLGITRPIPTRDLTPAERREREGQALAQGMLAVGALLRPLVLVVEQPPVEYSPDGQWRRRRCAECGFSDDTHCWVGLGSRGHLCRRDGATVMVLWSGDRW
ncbi:hypothetical protein [Amycolatopsis sp. NPDC051128]|uniref:hypothetical protein n=1 Tax=Amycolatopsis sp. NPDC051128 TaxID=3155412 RepID=UPI00343AA868